MSIYITAIIIRGSIKTQLMVAQKGRRTAGGGDHRKARRCRGSFRRSSAAAKVLAPINLPFYDPFGPIRSDSRSFLRTRKPYLIVRSAWLFYDTAEALGALLDHECQQFLAIRNI